MAMDREVVIVVDFEEDFLQVVDLMTVDLVKRVEVGRKRSC
jgi:hypothetical protein